MEMILQINGQLYQLSLLMMSSVDQELMHLRTRQWKLHLKLQLLVINHNTKF